MPVKEMDIKDVKMYDGNGNEIKIVDLELPQMLKPCILCGAFTANSVREPNICRDIPLCDKCKEEFKQCTVRGGHYYKAEIISGKCENCR